MTLPVTSVHTGVYTYTNLLSSLKWGHHATGWDDSLSEVMIGVTLRFLDSVTNVGRREESHDFDCSSLTLFGHWLLTLIPSEVKVHWWDSALSRSRQNIFNTTCHPLAGSAESAMLPEGSQGNTSNGLPGFSGRLLCVEKEENKVRRY